MRNNKLTFWFVVFGNEMECEDEKEARRKLELNPDL